MHAKARDPYQALHDLNKTNAKMSIHGVHWVIHKDLFSALFCCANANTIEPV